MSSALLWIWLGVSVVSACVVAIDVVRHAPEMWIMKIVWPVTALWAGPLGLAAYFRLRHTPKPPSLGVATTKAATHCGAGCTIGDILAALIAVGVPWSLAGHAIFGEWVYSLVAAFAFGIAFQYFTIVPMRHLAPGPGLVAALKADALSLAAWQLGMYGWMAIARFALHGRPFEKSDPLFWVMMQVAMLAGFITSYPVNAWLIEKGLKERM